MDARYTFELKNIPKNVLIKVTANSNYKLFLNGRIPTPKRIIEVGWKVDKNNDKVKISIPSSISCEIILPGKETIIKGYKKMSFHGIF